MHRGREELTPNTGLVVERCTLGDLCYSAFAAAGKRVTAVML
jgi:hypothetical protein